MRRDHRAVLDERVDADTGAERRPEALDPAGRRGEPARWILGVDPQLDRVAETRTRAPGVREQVRIAAGERLAHGGRSGPRLGHAIELRINAEDPARDFAPSPGRIERFRPPLGPGVRVDTFVEEGTTIPPYYDSLIAKLVVHDANRTLAISRAQRALSEFEIEGVPTTRTVLAEILASEEFQRGEYSTSFLEEAGARLPALAGS